MAFSKLSLSSGKHFRGHLRRFDTQTEACLGSVQQSPASVSDKHNQRELVQDQRLLGAITRFVIKIKEMLDSLMFSSICLNSEVKPA